MQKFLENLFMWGEVTLVLATLSLYRQPDHGQMICK